MEIEKKYQIKEMPCLDGAMTKEMEQGYLCTDPVVRIRRSNDKYILTCKSFDGMIGERRADVRMCQEYEINLSELNELDKELTRRGHRFVRYADDCMIFCKSRKSAERTLNNIVPYIEGKLFLKVNRTKTCVAHISKVKYLGYSFYRYKGICRFRVHPKSVTKMKNKIRELTDRHNGWGNEYRALKLTQFIRGWVNYFGMADMKGLLQSNDKWLRHRIRAIYWKQWKKPKTKYRKLKELGMNEDFIQWHANMRQGIWNCSNNRLVQFALSNEKLREWGYPTFTEFYLKICEN